MDGLFKFTELKQIFYHIRIDGDLWTNDSFKSQSIFLFHNISTRVIVGKLITSQFPKRYTKYSVSC